MSVDEMESLAESFLAGGKSLPLRATTTVDLAEFILRALPVLRAAEEWRSTAQSGHLGKHDENMNALIASVDEFKRGGR